MSCLTQHKTKEELSNWLMENASDNETTGFLDMLAGDIWDMMNGETDYKSLYEAEVEITHMKTEVNYSLGRAIHKQREKNKQLQEENKKLKEGTLLKFQEVEIADLQEENKKLQEENKKQKKEHIQHTMKTNRIATELYREVKYALGYGEFDEPDRKVMYEEIKKLKEENKKLKEGTLLKFQEVEIADLQEEIKKLQEREFRMCEIANANGWDIYPTDSEEEDDIEDNDPEEYGEYTWKEGLTAEEIAKGDTIDPLTGEPIKK